MPECSTPTVTVDRQEIQLGTYSSDTIARATFAEMCRERWAEDENAGSEDSPTRGALDDLADEHAIAVYLSVHRDTSYEITKLGDVPIEDGLPRGPDGAISMLRGGKFVTWEPEASRALLAKAFLD